MILQYACEFSIFFKDELGGIGCQSSKKEKLPDSRMLFQIETSLK